MTKAQEIELLRQFIAAIPEDSYLKPALQAVIPFIQSEMQSDFFPDIVGAFRARIDEINRLQDQIKNAKIDYEYIRKQENDLKTLANSHVEILNRARKDIAAIREKLSNV